MEGKESCLAVPMMPSVTDLFRVVLTTTKFTPKCRRNKRHPEDRLLSKALVRAAIAFSGLRYAIGIREQFLKVF